MTVPQNGSRHNDDALGPAEPDPREQGPDGQGPGGQGRDDADRGRGEGDALAPDRAFSGPRIRDLRGSRDVGGARIPNVFEGVAEPVSAGAATDPDDEGTQVQAGDIAKVTRERDELLDALRRTQADFENYKKRVERQSQEVRDRANERIVQGLLPALDAFSLARAHLGDKDPDPESKALLQAASLFEDALKKEGLELIDAKDVEFDPTSHEAVEHAPADASRDHTGDKVDDKDAEAAQVARPVVDEIYRPGYIWKGRVLRPAMVRVRG